MFWQEEEVENHKKGYTKIKSKQFRDLYNFDDGQSLGKGSFGTVAKVKTSQGQELAIKEFNKEAKKAFRQIMREVDSMKYLTHPNIVRLFDCYIVDDSNFYMVMEYCPGGSLPQYLEKYKDITQYDKMMLCKNIASGLAYAHQKFIVHRDLKPDNILIGRKNEAKICDFGCSARTINEEGSQIPLKSHIGTVAYMDKRVSYQENYDISVDVYSMGMIFYYIFKRKGIYDDYNTEYTINKCRSQINANYDQRMEELLKDIPNLIKEIIKNCLQEDHTKRYKALEISNIFEKEIMKNSRLSHIKSTVDEEEIQDQSSVFAIGLINYYKNIDKVQKNLATREKVFDLLFKKRDVIKRIKVMETIQHLEKKTRQYFTTFVLFYYFFWLDQFGKLLNRQETQFSYIYTDINPEALEDEVVQRIKKIISAEEGIYYHFFMKCCKNQRNKLSLQNEKIYLPSCYRKMIMEVTSKQLRYVSFEQFKDQELRAHIHEFIEKRIKKDYKTNGVKEQDQQAHKALAIIESIASQL